MFPDIKAEPKKEFCVMSAYLTEEDRVALLAFCAERNIPLDFID